MTEDITTTGAIDADEDALLVLLAAGGGVAARRRLLESHGTPAVALAAGARDWRTHGLDDEQIAALQQPDAVRLGRDRAW
ncbi:MAG TPA: DNA-protecting protein DprA, partial [Luteimonas sp.]